MDAEHFDKIAKALGGVNTRRAAFRTALGGLLGGIASVATLAGADAKNKGNNDNEKDNKKGGKKAAGKNGKKGKGGQGGGNDAATEEPVLDDAVDGGEIAEDGGLESEAAVRAADKKGNGKGKKGRGRKGNGKGRDRGTSGNTVPACTCPDRYSPKGCPNPGSQPQYTCKASASGAGCGVDGPNAPQGSVQVVCNGSTPKCVCNSNGCSVNGVDYDRGDDVACQPVRCDSICPTTTTTTTPAPCSPSTCPNGCCAGGACKPGNTRNFCGTGGGACDKCEGSETCQNGICVAPTTTTTTTTAAPTTTTTTTQPPGICSGTCGANRACAQPPRVGKYECYCAAGKTCEACIKDGFTLNEGEVCCSGCSSDGVCGPCATTTTTTTAAPTTTTAAPTTTTTTTSGPTCRATGESCETTAVYCVPAVGQAVCNEGICGVVGPVCSPRGSSCRDNPCCNRGDSCATEGQGRICRKAIVSAPPCAHVNERPAAGVGCCERLHLEQGVCKINRWDHCDPKNRGRKSGCERGARCIGGRVSPHGTPVCVPTKKRRGRGSERSAAAGITPAS
jgi:hypothetical protein